MTQTSLQNLPIQIYTFVKDFYVQKKISENFEKPKYSLNFEDRIIDMEVNMGTKDKKINKKIRFTFELDPDELEEPKSNSEEEVSDYIENSPIKEYLNTINIDGLTFFSFDSVKITDSPEDFFKKFNWEISDYQGWYLNISSGGSSLTMFGVSSDKEKPGYINDFEAFVSNKLDYNTASLMLGIAGGTLQRLNKYNLD